MRWARTLQGEVWRYEGAAGWYFVTLPATAAREIREVFGAAGGWGSVRVAATVGETTWATSIFPDKKTASYLLPIKAAVRKSEGIEAGRRIRYQLVIER